MPIRSSRHIDILSGGPGEANGADRGRDSFHDVDGDSKCLGQFTRAGTKPPFIVNAAPFFH